MNHAAWSETHPPEGSARQDITENSSHGQMAEMSSKLHSPHIHGVPDDNSVLVLQRLLVRALVSGAVACKKLSKPTDAVEMLSSAAEIEPAVRTTYLDPLQRDLKPP